MDDPGKPPRKRALCRRGRHHGRLRVSTTASPRLPWRREFSSHSIGPRLWKQAKASTIASDMAVKHWQAPHYVARSCKLIELGLGAILGNRLSFVEALHEAFVFGTHVIGENLGET